MIKDNIRQEELRHELSRLIIVLSYVLVILVLLVFLFFWFGCVLIVVSGCMVVVCRQNTRLYNVRGFGAPAQWYTEQGQGEPKIMIFSVISGQFPAPWFHLRCFKIPPNQNLASPTGIMHFQPIWRLYMKGQLIVTSQTGPTFDLKFFPCDFSCAFPKICFKNRCLLL